MGPTERASQRFFSTSEIFETLTALAEPLLKQLGLSEAEIEAKTLPELQLGLATLRSAISKPEGFGTVNLSVSADAGIVIGSTRSSSQIVMTILPILLQREQLVLRRIKILEETNRLRNIDDVVNLVEDGAVRSALQAELTNIKDKAAKYDREMETKKPRVFIGSSSEGSSIAELIQLNSDSSCESVIWSQGVFGLSEGTLESLVSAASKFDYAILVLTPDDLVTVRESTTQQPRDNVLFELGLFMGKLGRDRTFIVHGQGLDIKLPSDLAGVTTATFARRSDGNLRAALGPVSTRLKTSMGLFGSGG